MCQMTQFCMMMVQATYNIIDGFVLRPEEAKKGHVYPLDLSVLLWVYMVRWIVDFNFVLCCSFNKSQASFAMQLLTSSNHRFPCFRCFTTVRLQGAKPSYICLPFFATLRKESPELTLTADIFFIFYTLFIECTTVFRQDAKRRRAAAAQSKGGKKLN